MQHVFTDKHPMMATERKEGDGNVNFLKFSLYDMPGADSKTQMPTLFTHVLWRMSANLYIKSNYRERRR